MQPATRALTKAINITIPAPLIRQLDEIAIRNYTSRSDIIRQAVLQYIKTVAPPPAPIGLEAMNRQRLKDHLNKVVLDAEDEL